MFWFGGHSGGAGMSERGNVRLSADIRGCGMPEGDVRLSADIRRVWYGLRQSTGNSVATHGRPRSNLWLGFRQSTGRTPENRRFSGAASLGKWIIGLSPDRKAVWREADYPLASALCGYYTLNGLVNKGFSFLFRIVHKMFGFYAILFSDGFGKNGRRGVWVCRERIVL